MKNIKQKIIAITMATLLLAGTVTTLTACGNTSSDTTSSETSSIIASSSDSIPEVSSAPNSVAPASSKTPASSPPVAKSSISIVSIISPIRKGSTETLTIKGAPNTTYSISVVYNSGESTAQGLGNKTSDGNGNVSWSWKVGSRTANGTYYATVTGGGNFESAPFTVT